MSNPAASTQRYYIAGGGGSGKEENRKTRKCRTEEKREGVPRVEPLNQGNRPPDVEDNQGSWYRQRLGGQPRPSAHSRYIHVKQELHERGTLGPPTIEPTLLPPHLSICPLWTLKGLHL